MKTKSINYLIISILLLITACKSKNDIEQYIKTMPDDLKPELVRKFPDLLVKDTVDFATYKVLTNNDITYTHNDNAGTVQTEVLKMFKNSSTLYIVDLNMINSSVNCIDPISGLNTHKNVCGFNIYAYKKMNDKWENVSQNIFSTEIANLPKESEFQTAEFQNDTILLTDEDTRQKVKFIWKEDKFILHGNIPATFGKKPKDEENPVFTDFYKTWDIFKQALLLKDTNQIIKLTDTPVLQISSFNGIPSRITSLKNDSVKLLFDDHFFPATADDLDNTIKKNVITPTFLELGSKISFSAGCNGKPNGWIFYFAWCGNDVKLVGVEYVVTGE